MNKDQRRVKGVRKENIVSILVKLAKERRGISERPLMYKIERRGPRIESLEEHQIAHETLERRNHLQSQIETDH